jgi:UDP-N-acetylglucosamine 2-epimerase (non-hydrolysing)
MKKRTLDLVAGARPDFIKISPLYHRMVQSESGFEPRIVHTGQHYDARLSDVFFSDLGLPKPHVNLEVGSAPAAQQTARIMEAYEAHIQRSRPEAALVAGDTNSTLGCGLAAAQAHIPLIHLEAGLRSFDRSMPEELNRVLTDRIADVHLVPSEDAIANLRREGIDDEQIHFVGNTTIDALQAHLTQARAAGILNTLGLKPGAYGLVTLHRPGNVDDPAVLSELLSVLADLSSQLVLIVPAHPRLRKNMQSLDRRILEQVTRAPQLKFIDPLGYVDFLALEMHARLALTDSGGVQDETTVLGIPCLTLRHNTERPVTVHQGTNVLVGHDRSRIRDAFEEILALPMPGPRQPRQWDGQSAGRVLSALTTYLHATPGPVSRSASKRPVRAFLLPHAPAHRSATVRRELLYVAESGEWQDAAGTEHLADRVAAYIEAERVVLCADATGGFATLRAHYTGRVAVLGSFVPDDIAATLNGSAAGWASLSDPLPADVEMVYIPPVIPGTWQPAAPADVAEASGRYPTLPFVVDERWFEYSGTSVAEFLKRHDNLIVLRSLGPAFGLDGLGAGYMLASARMLPEGVAKAAEAGLLPVSRRAAWVALVDLGYCHEYVNSRLTTRSWICRALRELGFDIVELPGPHVFVSGPVPETLKGVPGIQFTDGGWLWAIGTPDQIEDQFAKLETRPAVANR